MTRALKPCGTVAAYKRHLYHRQPPCGACNRANAAKARQARDDARQAASRRAVLAETAYPPTWDARSLTRAQIEAAVLTSPRREGRWSQMRRVYGIEDYLHICGDRMSARQAALRIGVSERTVTRYRAALRDAS